jgi:hypothetical protein
MNYSYFFETEKPECWRKIKDTVWCAELAYLADIFSKLDSLNSSMPGQRENLYQQDE